MTIATAHNEARPHSATDLPELKLPVFFSRAKGLPRFVAVEKVERTTDRAMELTMRHVIRASDACMICGRAIHNDASKLIGIGPDCGDKMGVPRPDFDTAVSILAEMNQQLGKVRFKAWIPNYLLTDEVKALESARPDEPKPLRVIRLQDQHTLVITFPYDKELVADIKAIPDRRWDNEHKVWTVSVTLASAQPTLQFAARQDFHVSPDAKALLEATASEFHENVQASRAEDAELDIEGLARHPRPYQRAGVRYMVAKQRALNGDEMGTGKSIQSIIAVEAQKAYPCIVVCPASLKLNWTREWNMTVPSRKVAILSGRSTGALPAADVYVANYDILESWLAPKWDDKHKKIELLNGVLAHRGFKSLIADESHYLKSGTALRTKLVKAFARGIPVRYLLSGTPLLNRPHELVPQLDILDRLSDFGGEWKFLRRYAGAYKDSYGHWHFDGADNLQELNDLLRAHCMVRRLKKDVLKELPPKVRSVVPMDLDNREEYATAELDVATYLGQLAAEDAEFKESIANLSPDEQKRARRERMESAQYKAKKAEVLVRVNTLRKLAAKGKMAAVKAWVGDFLESGEKLVLFAHHNETVEALASQFGAPMLYGDTPLAERQRIVDRFQSDPTCQLIVLNIEAGGVGLTLTAASNVALVERAWVPGLEEQAEDRCHRIGVAEGTESVNCWYLMAEDSVDSYMGEVIDAKRLVVEAAANGDESSARQSILGDVLRKITEKGQQ